MRAEAEQARDRLADEVAELRKQLEERSAGGGRTAAADRAPRKAPGAPKRSRSPKKKRT